MLAEFDRKLLDGNLHRFVQPKGMP